MSSLTAQDMITHARGVLNELARVDLDALSDSSLLELAREMRPLVCVLQAAEVRLAGAIDERGATVGEGSGATVTWLRSQLRLGNAPLRLRCAKMIKAMPAIGAAFASGDLSIEHVEVISRVSAPLGEDALPDDVQHTLIDQARSLAPSRFRRVASRLGDSVIGTGRPGRQRIRPTGDRWLHLRRMADGTVALSGRFDAQSGDVLTATLATVTSADGSNDSRGVAHRRADAMLTLCRTVAEWRASDLSTENVRTEIHLSQTERSTRTPNSTPARKRRRGGRPRPRFRVAGRARTRHRG